MTLTELVLCAGNHARCFCVASVAKAQQDGHFLSAVAGAVAQSHRGTGRRLCPEGRVQEPVWLLLVLRPAPNRTSISSYLPAEDSHGKGCSTPLIHSADSPDACAGAGLMEAPCDPRSSSAPPSFWGAGVLVLTFASETSVILGLKGAPSLGASLLGSLELTPSSWH